MPFDPPDDKNGRDYMGLFASDLIVARLFGQDDRVVAIETSGTIHNLGVDGEYLIPAADGSWLCASQTAIDGPPKCS